MKIANLPAKFPIPFAAGAGGGFIRAIPQASQIGITAGAASLTDGFPPATFQPVGAGGTPPLGQDMNGIINQITLWSQWQNAGGLVPYDSAFSTSIGGYPQGAILAGTTAGQIWLSTVDDNTTNPNAGGTGWLLMSSALGVLNSQYSSAVDTGTATALVVALSPVPTAYTKFMSFEVQVANTATGPATINVNGLGAKAITDLNGAPITPGFWQAGNILSMIYDGTNVRVVGGNRSLTAAFTSSYSTPQGLANAVLAIVNFATSSGSTSFGTYAGSVFTFTRAGTYAIAAQIGLSIATSGSTNIAVAIQLRQNGTPPVGAANGDSTYLIAAASPTFAQYVTSVINAAVGDTVTLYAQAGSSTNFSSASCTSASLGITLIN